MSWRRALAGVFALALALRAAFVLWAPGVVSGDALWHAARAWGIANGHGYVDLDGSPSIAWMPGWSLLLGGLYALFGQARACALASVQQRTTGHVQAHRGTSRSARRPSSE